jgi:predicted amidohydrolase YtcJ
MKTPATIRPHPADRRSSMPAISLLTLFLLTACKPAGEPAAPAAESPPPGDGAVLLVHNARIYTADPGNTVMTNGAMALGADGRILSLGDSRPMLGLYANVEAVDMQGRSILPGFIDSHGHLYGLAVTYTRANLVGAASKDEVIGRLREFAAGLPEGEWLLGRGWDQNDWPEQAFPDRRDLDAEFPDRPVWLERIDGHAAWGNTRALAEADLDFSGDWQVEGGMIHRDDAGQPTGIFIDGAAELVESVVPGPSPEVVSEALDAAVQTLVSLGLTGVHDPGVSREIVDLYRQKLAQGKLPLRVYAMADGANETLDWLCENGPVADPDGRIVMRSVKLYADGALGSRGAALLQDYSDDPGNRGLLFLSDGQLEQQLRRVMSCGLQVGVHAIGDAANRQVLDAYEKVMADFPDNPGRHRIEHAQVLSPDDIGRFARLDVIAAMQPVHATSDMYWAVGRLGEERAAGAYAWRSLLDSGATLSFGSDFPVEEVSPMLGMYAAVTRRDLEGWPEGGWFPQERLTREEALRAFTIDAAYAGFMEADVGSLEVGKLADFIVLDRDIVQAPADEINRARVLQTWLAGQIVYAADR